MNESDEIAAALLEAAPDAMIVVGESGLIERANQQAELLFGYERVQLVGMMLETLIPTELRERHVAHRATYRADPRRRSMASNLDLWARHRDGTDIPVEIALSPLSEAGRVSTIAAIRDVRSQRAERLEREVVRHVIDATHDGVFVFEPDGLAFVYVNRGATVQTGYSRAELTSGMTPVDIKPEFTDESFAQFVRPLIADDVESLWFTTVHRRKDGSEVHVEVVLEFPHPATSDQPRLLVALVRDITSRVEAAEQLRVKAEQFAAAFQASPVPNVLVSLASDDLVIVDENRANRALRTDNGGSSVGSSLAMLIHQDERSGFVSFVKGAGNRPAGAGPQQFRIVTDRDREVWVEVSATPTEHADQCLVQMLDVTARHDLQVEQQRRSVLEDRERIGRDLHDMVIQRLFATGMQLQAITPMAESADVAARIVAAVDDLDATIREIRAAIFDLGESGVRTPLRDRLDDVVRQKKAVLGFEPVVELYGNFDEVAEHVADELLATVAEALSNVARHAGATAVELVVSRSETTTSVEVTDNGVGLSDGPRRGRGINNMKARAELLGGTCIVGPADVGTRVRWAVPTTT